MPEAANVIDFRSDDDDTTLVRVAFNRDHAATDLASFEVEVVSDGLNASRGVLTTADGDALAKFVAGLAEDWRGWEGVRRWDALELGMSIDATHRGSHVGLLITLRRDYSPDAWEARVPITIAAGESLSQLAGAVARIF